MESWDTQNLNTKPTESSHLIVFSALPTLNRDKASKPGLQASSFFFSLWTILKSSPSRQNGGHFLKIFCQQSCPSKNPKCSCKPLFFFSPQKFGCWFEFFSPCYVMLWIFLFVFWLLIFLGWPLHFWY